MEREYTGAGIGVWAIAIILLLVVFAGRGFGGFGGGDYNCNDNVGTRAILETQFAGFSGLTNQINQSAYANAAQIYGIEERMQAQEIQNLRDANFKLYADKVSLENRMFEEKNFCIINNRLTSIEDRMLTAPKFFPCGQTCPATTGCGGSTTV